MHGQFEWTIFRRRPVNSVAMCLSATIPRDFNFELADTILSRHLSRANDILEQHAELSNAKLRHPKTTDDTPAIMLATSCGAVETVERLISMGVSPETEYEKEG